MTFGNRLKMVRGEMSRDDFALHLKVHKNTIARWERGEAFPDAQEIEQVLKAYPQINPTWFVLGEGTIKRVEEAAYKVVQEPGPQVFISHKHGDPDLDEIINILQHDLPEAKRFVLQVLKGRKEVKKGLEGLGMKLKEDI